MGAGGAPRGGWRARDGAMSGGTAGSGPERGAWAPLTREPVEDLYVLRDGKPVRITVRTGLSDGSFTEVRSDELREGDAIVVGVEQPRQRANVQLPPGMGGGGGPMGGVRRR